MTQAFTLHITPPWQASNSNNTLNFSAENPQVYKSHKINSMKTEKIALPPDYVNTSFFFLINLLVTGNNEI